jgi:hypothetical protein
MYGWRLSQSPLYLRRQVTAMGRVWLEFWPERLAIVPADWRSEVAPSEAVFAGALGGFTACVPA